MDRLLHIDDKTKIPLFTVVAGLPLLFATMFWIGTVSSRVTSDAERVERIADKLKRMDDADLVVLEKLTDIVQRLARVEQKLDDLK